MILLCGINMGDSVYCAPLLASSIIVNLQLKALLFIDRARLSGGGNRNACISSARPTNCFCFQ